jgi:hypothetical protein
MSGVEVGGYVEGSYSKLEIYTSFKSPQAEQMTWIVYR